MSNPSQNLPAAGRTASILKNLALWMGFFVFIGSAIFLQDTISARLRKNPQLYHDRLHLPSSDYLKFVTLGYDQFTSDYFWLRAIQTFGASYADKSNLTQLEGYFDAITDLDPRFGQVYTFANMVLGEEAGDHKKGMAILDKGMLKNPRQYRIPFEAAYFAYWNMNDAKLAKYYVRMAMKAPDCPTFVQGWIPYFDMKAGKYIAAFETTFVQYAQFFNAGNADFTSLRRKSMRKVVHDWYEAELRRKSLEYHAANGVYPTVKQLEDQGLLKDVEWPDWQLISHLIAEIEEKHQLFPDSHEELAALAKKFVRTGWTKMPNCPMSFNPHFPSYILPVGQPPQKPYPGDGHMVDNPLFAISELELVKTVVEQLGIVGREVEKYHAAHGLACPATLAELMPDHFTQYLQEPWGGEWVWDPLTCTLTTSSHPDIINKYAEAPFFK